MPTFSHNGATIAYDLEGSGPPIIHITGLTDHHNSHGSTKLRNAFADQHTVLSLDNRGSGQTITEPGASATIEDMADDIAALIAHHNLAPIHVHGISMGGLIAKSLVLRYPEMVRTLISTVSSAGTDYPLGRHYLHTWREMLDRDLPRDVVNRFTATFLLGEEAFQNDRLIDSWIASRPDPHQQTREGFDLQMSAVNGVDLRPYLSDIHVPTLVTGSPSDKLTPFYYQQEVADGIPHAEFKPYPGGHVFMTIPLYDKPYVQDVLAFWERHTP